MNIRRKSLWLGTLAATLLSCGAQAKEAVSLNVYSTQEEHLIRPAFDLFEKANPGIKVRLTTLGDGALISRLELEGKDTQADMVMTADVANLQKLENKGLLAPVKSDVLAANIPAHLRDDSGHWFGFTTRSRVIFYAKDRVKPEDIATYEDLADAKWKGRIMVRSSSNDYNQSLLASIIAHDGKDKALAWAKSVVANMKAPPAGGDRDQLRAVAAGKGDIAIANTYYYGLLQHSPDARDVELASKLGILFPNQNGRGAHVNIRGGGITVHGKHLAEAKKLLEFLSSEPAQTFFAEKNYEYPANPAFKPSKDVAAWGAPKFDSLPLSKVGELNAEAVKLFDEAGWQ